MPNLFRIERIPSAAPAERHCNSRLLR